MTMSDIELISSIKLSVATFCWVMNHLVIRWDHENLNEYIAHLLEEVTWKVTSGKEGKLGKQVDKFLLL